MDSFCCGFIDGGIRAAALAADVERLLTPLLAVDEAADEYDKTVNEQQNVEYFIYQSQLN